MQPLKCFYYINLNGCGYTYIHTCTDSVQNRYIREETLSQAQGGYNLDRETKLCIKHSRCHVPFGCQKKIFRHRIQEQILEKPGKPHHVEQRTNTSSWSIVQYCSNIANFLPAQHVIITISSTYCCPSTALKRSPAAPVHRHWDPWEMLMADKMGVNPPGEKTFGRLPSLKPTVLQLKIRLPKK